MVTFLLTTAAAAAAAAVPQQAKGCPEVKEMKGVCPYYGLPYFKGIMHDSKVLPVPYPYNATYPPEHGNSSYAGGYGNSSGGYGGSSGGYGGSNGSYAGSSGSYAGSSGSYGGSSAGYGSSGRRLLAPAAAGGAAAECLKNATGSYMPHQVRSIGLSVFRLGVRALNRDQTQRTGVSQGGGGGGV
jgi:hypothetical protein